MAVRATERRLIALEKALLVAEEPLPLDMTPVERTQRLLAMLHGPRMTEAERERTRQLREIFARNGIEV